MPSTSEEYVDEDGNNIVASEDSIIITNVCLLSGMDIEDETTVECNHFKEKIHKTDAVPFLKHL
jgi:hypothetical protein